MLMLVSYPKLKLEGKHANGSQFTNSKNTSLDQSVPGSTKSSLTSALCSSRTVSSLITQTLAVSPKP